MNFNDVLKSFLDELSHVFPDEPSIAAFAGGLDAIVDANVTMPRLMFAEALAPHADLLKARDGRLFAAIRFPGGIDFAKLWASNLSDATRTAIWDYLDLLHALSQVSDGPAGGGVGGVGGVEALAIQAAARCAEKMKAEGVDPASLVDAVLRDVPEDVSRSIKGLADECAAKMQGGGASMDEVIADLVGRIETMDLKGLENADLSKLSDIMGIPAGMLGGVTGDQDDELLKMLSEPASGPTKSKKSKRKK